MGIENTLAERGERYGSFEERAYVCQELQKDIRDLFPAGWARLSCAQQQALTVIADKVSRILVGDPNYADNWHDIQGYARLVEEGLPAAKAPANDNLPLPEGFLPWNPHSGDVPPAMETVDMAVLRGGTVIKGCDANFWESAEYADFEIVGYKLHAAEEPVQANDNIGPIVQLKRLGELPRQVLEMVRTACEAELLRKRADEMQGRTDG